MNNGFILKIRHISKTYPLFIILNDVYFDLYKMEVRILLEANRTGESTLIMILSGSYHKTSCKIFLTSLKISTKNTEHIKILFIDVIYQKINLVSHLSPGEYIFLAGGLSRIWDYEL